MSGWSCALELDQDRRIIGGSQEALGAAIRRGADLRIYTEFRHNEHIDTASADPEWVREVAEFRNTYLVEDCWVAGIMTLRQPIGLPDGFGPRPSMSFFLYNQDGGQAIARPHLDGPPAGGEPGPAPLDDHTAMPRYHQLDNWDARTNAPSSNFVYDFQVYRYLVRDDWEEVLACGADGRPLSGSVAALERAFSQGSEIKVGMRGLCADLGPGLDHELFVQTHSCYYYTEQRLFIGATQPVVRVAPAMPLRYFSRGWDFGWVLARSDGQVASLLCDPYTLRFERRQQRCALRWFAR